MAGAVMVGVVVSAFVAGAAPRRAELSPRAVSVAGDDAAAIDHAMHDAMSPAAEMTHDHGMTAGEGRPSVLQDASIPPGNDDAAARLAASPRRGEWAMIRAGSDSVRAWVVYPERREGAAVVVAIHDNQGMSNWIRSVADQLAADGFIGIAPDLLSMMDVARGEDGMSDGAAVRSVIGQVDQATRDRFIRAVGEWGTKLQGAPPKYGIVGFCWGGGTVFANATATPPSLGAVAVYYGTSPSADALAGVRVPVIGFYGGTDQRVNATIPAAESALKSAGRTYEPHVLEGAGHGFLRNQGGQDGANLAAAKQSWPLTMRWFRSHLAL
jgi:carboxymethylenebutenolidase